ncbi:MAG: xylulokinase [Pseudomonadota bacterium]
MSYLGIDLGTSGLRALLVDDNGTPLGSAERHYASQHPYPGWSEQNPADWIDALDGAVQDLAGRYAEFAELHGIGVAGHMHGATLLDDHGAVIRPCILWNDSRAHTEAAALDQTPDVRSISGNIVFPGFTAPKLKWVQEHEPEHYARVAKVLLPAAYLNFYLTGDYVADMSDSAGTSWLDVEQRNWSDTLLTAGGMTASQMPRLVEGCARAGTLRPNLADTWGVPRDVVVAGGAGDNAAAACGIGVLKEGAGFLSLGTSGVLLAARDGYFPAADSALHTFCHAVPDRWYQMGVMLSATDSLNWLGHISGATPAELTAQLGPDLVAPGRIVFLPYLSGERTPHNDASIRGSFIGLGHDTGRVELTRAVLEGVAFGLRDSYEALQNSGAQLNRLVAIGGGAKSEYWLKLIATALNVSLDVPEDGEFGAALGASRLAHIASTQRDPDEILVSPRIERQVCPDPELIAAYDDAFSRFRAAYPATRSLI